MRLLAALPLLALAPLSAQSGVVDQSSPFAGAGFNGDAPGTWQQQVRAGVGGTLEGIRLRMYSPLGQPGTVDVALRPGGAWSGSAPWWSGTAQTSGLGAGVWESVFLDVITAGVTLAAGEVFVIELSGTGTGTWVEGAFVAPPGTPLYPEPLYRNQNLYAVGWTIGFETWMLTGPPPPTLAIAGVCPGSATVTMGNLTPGGRVALAVSPQLGSTVLAGGSCAGATIGLLNPQIKIVAFADPGGSLQLSSVNVPAAACGAIHVLAFDVSSCRASNIVSI